VLPDQQAGLLGQRRAQQDIAVGAGRRLAER
jgi:hypothetical protein